MCSTTTSVTPVSCRRRTSAIARWISAGLRPASASSSSSRRGRGRERARDLEAFAAGGAEPVRRLLGERLELGQLEHALRLGARRPVVRMAEERADHDVLEHGHVLEGRRHLEGAGDAAPGVLLGRGPGHVQPGEGDAAGARGQIAREAVEEGRLAGAVRADQAHDLALGDREVGPGDRAKAAERHRDRLRLKQHGGALPDRPGRGDGGRRRARCRSGRPAGSGRAKG